MTAQPKLKIIWRAWENTSQARFIECPFREILYSGTRGPGKSDALLAKFNKHCGQGWGEDWRGVIFAKQYKNLDDMVAKGKKMFLSQGIGIKWLASKSDYKFVWPTGEELLFRVAEKDDDYWNYHGHNYPFVAFEELTKWSTPNLYDSLKSVNRSPVKGIPKFYLANTNPYGAGHAWVKDRWITPNPKLTTMGAVIPSANDDEQPRIRFDGDIMENKLLVENDPEYIKSLENIENESLRMAWRYGSWDVNVGAFFHGYLSQENNMVEPFNPPASWPRFRAYDIGTARPYSIGYYAVNPDGVVYRYKEIYGWGGKPNVGTGETYNQVCDRMDKIELIEKRSKVDFFNNPADHNLWTNSGHEKDGSEIFAERGYYWSKAPKGKGSVESGLKLMKQMFLDGQIKITSNCTHFWRTVPNMMHDDNDWEVIDTDMEDHVCDEVRYAVTSRHLKAKKAIKKQTKQKDTAIAGDPRLAHLLK